MIFITKKIRAKLLLLHRLRTTLIEYRRWLSEFPDVARVLDNINANYNIAPGAFETVTYEDVSKMREDMRKRQKLGTVYMLYRDDAWHVCNENDAGAVKFFTEHICPDCKNTGSRDSGGQHPWGEAIYVSCDCGMYELRNKQ